jgi:hypothetical protein
MCLAVLLSGRAWADDFYRELAGHWAPDVWQDTWYYIEGDYITAFDADGDWIGANNHESLKAGRFAPYPAYVYCSVLETETHYLIIYEFFHPFDYDRRWLKWLPGAFHENDTEGVMVAVKKEEGEPYGVFRFMETKPHGYTRYYTNDPEVKHKGSKPAERASLRGGSHPEIYVQRGGHGPYGLHARGGGLSIRHGFHGGAGVVYKYEGVAGTPDGPNDREVGYDLISVTSERGLWTRRCNREAFDDYRPYHPPPGRPGVPDELYCEGGVIPFNLDGDTSGDSGGVDSAGVPWGHYGLDPAWTAAGQWELPERFSVEYIYNPYLGMNGREGLR